MSAGLRPTLFVVLLVAALAAAACGRPTESTREAHRSLGNIDSGDGQLVSRFLIGGWVIPKNEEAGPFAEILKASVITSEKELRDLLESLDLVRIRGNTEVLSRADFSKEVILAALYLWRPLKGDPFSITNITVKGSDVIVNVELESDPQGHESPFLLAPINIVSVDRADLPKGVPAKFNFLVNGELASSHTVTLE